MKVTMKQIAEMHHVSVNAVSLALNNKSGVSEDLRIKILHTAEELGYLETKEKFIKTFSRTNLCVMTQKKYSDDTNFYGRVLYAVVEEARKNGFDALMNFFDDEKLEIPKMIEEHRVSGIIIIGKISDENIEKLQRYRIPIVLADHASLTKNIDSILTDNKLGGFIVTKYLLEKGFQEIGFFGELSYSLSIKERFWGYKEALGEFGGACIRETLQDYVDQYSITQGIEEAVLNNDNRKIANVVKQKGRLPQVFICSNDKAAISLMIALQEMEYRIPEDISLIGFDNIDMCEKIRPKLTTVNVNKEMMGKRAVQRIIYRIAHKECLTENAVIGVEMVERESVRLSGKRNPQSRG